MPRAGVATPEERIPASAAADAGRVPWGRDAPLTDEQARERLIDAAERCFERHGVTKTTIEDIAREANVSRRTVYRYFAGRDELIVGVFMRETDQIFDDVVAFMEQQPTYADAAVESLLYAVDLIRDATYVQPLLDAESAAFTTSRVGASRVFFDRVKEAAGPYFARIQEAGEVRADLEFDDVAEWLVRIMLSLLNTPSPVGRDRDGYRELLRTFMLPGLVDDPGGEIGGGPGEGAIEQ